MKATPIHKYYKLVITSNQTTVSEISLTENQYLNIESILFNNCIDYTSTIFHNFKDERNMYCTFIIDVNKVTTLITTLL